MFESRSPFLGLNEETVSKIIPHSEQRVITDKPYKILDAPGIEDDYYLNLLDWSKSDLLGVALKSNVYTWTAANGSVSKLCDFGADEIVTSVRWCKQGKQLAVAT